MRECEINYKYDRAIDLIRRIKTEETHERCIDRHKAFDLAISVLEKQIPKKPKAYVERGKYFDYECPKCGMTYGQTTWHGKFCPNCGQALDWRDIE